MLATAGVAVYSSVARSLPDPTKARPRGRDQTTQVLDREGRLIVELFAEQNRKDVALKKMSKDFRHAVVSTEDERYYEHRGVDPIGVMRAVWVDVRTRSAAQGGSTITQQYVVNAFVEREDTLTRKLKEAMLAYRLEKGHSKDEILEMYLNTIYFGHGAYGVQTGAKTYFGKDAKDLTLGEAAMLAGIIKSPGRYSPYLDPDAARQRRKTVLGQMLRQGYITRAEHDTASIEDIELAGLDRQGSRLAPYFMEHVKALLVDKYGSEVVFRGGLRVRTTLDLKMQTAAERAVTEHLNRQGDPSASVVTLDPKTGEILAMVGGRDFRSQQYNVAVQGRRQPGSAFKPFVLAAALKSGVSPEATYECAATVLGQPNGKPWKVTGASGGRSGPMRLREATEQSVNSVFAQLILQLGANKVARLADSMGIDTSITPVPAIALGGLKESVSPLEMAAAYGTLANGGVAMKPHAILEVRDSKGTELMKAKRRKSKALDAATAYLVTDILRGVIRSGTGKTAQIGRPAAGKTGTTQEYRDAWFVGYTPSLVTAVWVGHPDAQREMKSVHGVAVTGGSFPARIWAAFMRAALAGRPVEQFKRPPGLTNRTICLETGGVATGFCPETGGGLFLAAHVAEACEKHTSATTITVPNVIGMAKEAAAAALKALMLQVSIKEKDVSHVPAGLVADQDPKGGSEGTTQTVVTIVVSKGAAKSKLPVAAFSFQPAEPSWQAEVVFDAAASSDDKTIVGYVWEFGDGSKGQGVKTSHTYTAPGSYEVTLWVTDDDGQTSAVTRPVVVK